MKLTEWFNEGCTYPEGVELYAELAANKALKTMLGFGENKFSGCKLYAALEALQQTTSLKKDQEEAVQRDLQLTKLY